MRIRKSFGPGEDVTPTIVHPEHGLLLLLGGASINAGRVVAY